MLIEKRKNSKSRLRNRPIRRQNRDFYLPSGVRTPEPGVAYLMVMDCRIIGLHAETEHLWRKASDRRQQRIGRDDTVALGGHQRNPGVDQLLLGIEHVERCALADTRLLADAVQCNLRSVDLGGGGLDLSLRGFKLAPRLDQCLLRLIPCSIKINPALAERLPWLGEWSHIRCAPW